MKDKSYRIEQDSMGELAVPASALWGAQTQRAVQNFPISGLPMPGRFVHALGLIKWAAAKVNLELGLLPSDVAAAIQSAADGAGYGIVRELVGHGIGRDPHEDPQVPNYGRRGRGMRLEVGLVLAIEPMFNLGTEKVRTLPDRWTVITADRTVSAHFEHMVLITDDEPEILTPRARSYAPAEI